MHSWVFIQQVTSYRCNSVDSHNLIVKILIIGWSNLKVGLKNIPKLSPLAYFTKLAFVPKN